MTKLATALAVMISLAAAGSAAAQQTPAPAAVEWLLPPAAPVKPQTDEEKQRGMSSGRDLPALELLQPTLDPALPAYQPRPGMKLQGHFKAAASDVLPRLRKRGSPRFASTIRACGSTSIRRTPAASAPRSS